MVVFIFWLSLRVLFLCFWRVLRYLKIWGKICFCRYLFSVFFWLGCFCFRWVCLVGGLLLEGVSLLFGVVLFGEIFGLKEVVNSKLFWLGIGSVVFWNGKCVGEVVVVIVEFMEFWVVVEDVLRSVYFKNV